MWFLNGSKYWGTTYSYHMSWICLESTMEENSTSVANIVAVALFLSLWLTSRSWTRTLLMAFNQRTLDGLKGNGAPSSLNLEKQGEKHREVNLCLSTSEHTVLVFLISGNLKETEFPYLCSVSELFSGRALFFRPLKVSVDSPQTSLSSSVDWPLATRCPQACSGRPLEDGWRPMLW